jgi:hypothetical protein
MAVIDSIIPFTYKWEGGLSRSASDTAKRKPAPYAIKDPKDGKLKTGWHTNKGVTYEAFQAASKKYGFADTAQNFERMPEDIWLKIAKLSYWDKLNLDAVKSQVVANFMFGWIWGSWLGWTPRMKRYLASKGIIWSTTDLKGLPDKLNQLTAKYGEKVILDELIEQKRQFLLSLGQPANEKGWLRRLEDFKNYSYSLLGSGVKQIEDTIEAVKKKPVTTALITATIIVSGFVLYTIYLTKKNK